MDDPNSIILAQKEQIARYQTRLKDVVTAYKSLLNEKQALEAVLSAKKPKEENGEKTETEEDSRDEDSPDQLAVLLDSLKTLSEEKKKMESSFLSDKKNLRQELSTKDIVIKELQEKIKSLELDKQNMKTKLINYDRILNDERHLKDNLETQLNQLKTQFSQTSNSDKVINSLNQELSELKKKLKAYENNKLKDDSNVLHALQQEMDNLKQQHINNLTIEKQRANEANERNKKLTALHEERVQNLESRIAELSKNFAHYHQLRESDQKSIVQLKEKISQLTKSTEDTDNQPHSSSSKKFSNVYQIIDELQGLKQLLLYENTKLEHPIDLSSYIFLNPANKDDTVVSAEKYALMKNEKDRLTAENEVLKGQLVDQNESLKTLQEKVVVLNMNIDEYETEIKNKSISLNNELKAERAKNRDVINNMEVDYRSRISQLEQQLQKQRERSLTLLDEKENEIRALKTSYELFIPKKSGTDDDETQSNGSRKPSTAQHHLGMVLNQQNSSSSNSPETYMIFYSNELARKDLELSSIRKSKRECEELIRQTLKEKIMIQEDLDEKIANLEQKVYFLEKMKSREGANLEYLKNVTLSYLTTSDSQAKKKMLNAIGAVLKFDDHENTLINNYFGKKK